MALRKPKQSKFQRYGQDFAALLNTELVLAHGDPNQRTTLYKHQIEAALKTKAWFESDWNGKPSKPAVIVAPTDSRKTGIVTLLPYVLECPNVIILSPYPSISEQLAEAFGKYEHEDTFYVKTNLMDAEMVKDYIEPVNILYHTNQVRQMAATRLLIINAQHVSRQLKMSLTVEEEIDNVREKFKHFRTIIVHEAHYYPADSWVAICDIFRGIGKQIIFVTATPLSRENSILGPDQEVTYGILRKDIIGVSVRDVRFEEITEIQKEKVEDFDSAEIKMLKDRILGYLTDHDELVPEVTHKAMILVCSGATSEQYLARELGKVATYHNEKVVKTSGDHNSLMSHSFVPKDYVAEYNRFKEIRQRNLELFDKNPDVKILVVGGLVSEGYENSDISVCVVLDKVRELTLFTQFIGRCRRLSMPGDRVKAVVLSLPGFQQQEMYNWYTKIREDEDEKV